MKPSLPIPLALLAALAVGCSLASTTDGSAPGDLGNGGFYFSCNDAVACAPYSNDASKFPKAVSLGSTFQVRFVPKTGSTAGIHFDERATDRGLTIAPVGGEYVSRGPSGLAAQKPGWATLASRDASGQLIDYIVVRVAKPDTLVVYAADDTHAAPTRVDSVSLSANSRRSFRAFAQEKKQDLAGSLQIEWTSSNPSVVDIENANDGTATIIAKSSGSAKLVATGGTFVQQVPVEVTP